MLHLPGCCNFGIGAGNLYFGKVHMLKFHLPQHRSRHEVFPQFAPCPPCFSLQIFSFCVSFGHVLSQYRIKWDAIYVTNAMHLVVVLLCTADKKYVFHLHFQSIVIPSIVKTVVPSCSLSVSLKLSCLFENHHCCVVTKNFILKHNTDVQPFFHF